MKLHLGDSNKRLAGRNGSAEAELGIAVEHFIGKPVHLGIFHLLVSHTAVDETDLGCEFRPFPFSLFCIVGQLGIAEFPLAQGFAEMSNLKVVRGQLGLQVVNGLIGDLLLAA